MSTHHLATENLSKNFDGLLAVDCVNISFQTTKVHAIIGPNGAGKTTLINLLSGDLLPSLGSISYKDRNIAGMPAFAISQLGIGRSYQKTNIFPDFTCWQNCWLGAQSRLPTSLRFFKPAKKYEKVHQQTEKAIALCGVKPLNFSSTHDFPFETYVKDSVKSNKENPAVQPVT